MIFFFLINLWKHLSLTLDVVVWKILREKKMATLQTFLNEWTTDIAFHLSFTEICNVIFSLSCGFCGPEDSY